MLNPLLDCFSPGKTAYLPGATGEIDALAQALTAHPQRARGMHFFGCFVPGMNEFDYAGIHEEARLTTFMLPRAMQASFRAGRVDIIPRVYSAVTQCLTADPFDIAVAHVAPPGDDGLCSYGISSDFTPLVWPRAKTKVAFINPAMPTMQRGPRLDLKDADIVVESASTLVTAQIGTASGPSAEIARMIAQLIPDGASIQTGIGGAPGGIWSYLLGHKNLTIRSGMAHDWARDLQDAGALDADGQHMVGIAYGSTDFYRYLSETDLIAFVSTPTSHGIKALAAVDKLHSVNGALEVDLFGQVNVEWQNGRMLSGVGGGPDFARAAAASTGGRSIIALPATAKKGTLSRIVPQLTAPTVGLPRSDVDTIVTQHGVAQVSDLSMDKRAEALIGIAEPAFRETLERSWREMRAKF